MVGTIRTMSTSVELLARSWHESGDRLEERCRGLTDEEFFWLPVSRGWTIKPDPTEPGVWTYDYDFSPPPPAPVTSIGWRLVHVAAANEIYWEYAFGPGERTFLDLETPGNAHDALEMWQRSRRPVSEWIDAASDEDLADVRPSHLGDPRSAGEVMRILLDEQVHHGAEIGLLRDLYVRRAEVAKA
jgi:hypothetical protein